jgi:hypothetical protein
MIRLIVHPKSALAHHDYLAVTRINARASVASQVFPMSDKYLGSVTHV